MIVLTQQDLLVEVTQAELEELAQAALEPGQPDPIQTAIAEALAEIRAHLAPEVLSDDALRAIWRPLAIYRLYHRRAAEVPAKRRQARDDALALLRALAPARAATPEYGSEARIRMRLG
jgi:hypothetical protein